MELNELKKKYTGFEKKYKLPSFKELNEDFEIDKIEKESDTLLRVIRKTVIDKIVNSMSFVEMLLNPVNAPRLYFSYLKGVTVADREQIDKIYKILASLSVLSLEMEIDYSEKKEADFIKKAFNDWNQVKPEFRRIVEGIKKPAIGIMKEKSYFG